MVIKTLRIDVLLPWLQFKDGNSYSKIYTYSAILIQILQGNTNTYLEKKNHLEPPIWASKIRVIPYSSHRRTVCMRVELYGCFWSGKCHLFLRLPTKARVIYRYQAVLRHTFDILFDRLYKRRSFSIWLQIFSCAYVRRLHRHSWTDFGDSFLLERGCPFKFEVSIKPVCGDESRLLNITCFLLTNWNKTWHIGVW